MSTASEGNGTAPSPLTLVDPFQGERTMLILVGLIASGKSTFAEALESYFPRFRRCNQDDLGNRKLVEELAHQTLREGRSPCIDRTNFNAVQRSYWTAIAREFSGTSISVIVFNTPFHVCASRLQRRISHPTIRDAQHGMAILQKFASDFQLPLPSEGYDRIMYLRPEDHPRPHYTRDDVLSILKRLKASTRDSDSISVTQQNGETHFGRGRGYSRIHQAHGRRGGGRYRGLSESSARGTLFGLPRNISRGGGSSESNQRHLDPGASTNREIPDQRSPARANMPPMESSKGSGSAEERHNSS